MRNETEIKKVFLRLVDSKPIETINVSMICEELNIKRQTFYYHYSDILELVEAIFEDYADEILNGDIQDNYLKSALQFSYDNIYLISSCINGGLKDAVNQYFTNLVLPHVSSCVYELDNIKNLNNSDIKEIISYHSEALSLLLIENFKNGELKNYDRLINKINIFLNKEVLEKTASLYYEKRREI